MKKLFVIGVALILAGGLYAQGSVGLKGGLNYGSFDSGVEGEDAYTGLGYHFGLEAGYMPMPSIGVDIGGFYYIGKWSTTVDDVDVEMTINSIYIPLSLRYVFAAAPTVNPYVKLGGAVMMESSGETTTGEEDPVDIPDEFIETDFFILGGFGVDIGATPTISVRPELVFQYNITGDRDDTTDQDESAYDFLFSLGFYYAF